MFLYTNVLIRHPFYALPFTLWFCREREMEKFRVAVSVPSGTRMSFLLSYEELLTRRLGHYDLSLSLRPGQLVQNLTLDVNISERTGLSFIKVLPLKMSRLLSNTAQGENLSEWLALAALLKKSLVIVMYCEIMYNMYTNYKGPPATQHIKMKKC